MHRLSSRQSKQARSMLKWNVQDLASRCRILNARRIEEFERGSVRLVSAENKELCDIFEKQGLAFKGEHEVKAKRPVSGAATESHGKATGGGGGPAEQQRVDVTDEMMSQAIEDRGDELEKKEHDRLKRGLERF